MSGFRKGDRVYRTRAWRHGNIGDQGTVLVVNPTGSLKIEMDNGHVTPNGSSCKFAHTKQSNVSGVDNMSAKSPFSIKIAQQTTVNGVVVDKNYSDDMLLADISSAEAAIAEMEKMDAKPKVVSDRIAALKEGIAGLVKILDDRSKEA